jgi:hypothetical protein
MAGAALGVVLAFSGMSGAIAADITPPDKAFAQPVGSDYFLADYTAYEAYLKTLAGQSDRMKLVDIGKTEEGRTQWVAIVSSPANLAKLDDYKEIARKLAKADGVSKDEARNSPPRASRSSGSTPVCTPARPSPRKVRSRCCTGC